ncbi:MAG: hypothetical protein K940chlam7_00010 [Chlamydiae bacterium]|nr:hypothetical protein [Chlamydiota bacterium]
MNQRSQSLLLIAVAVTMIHTVAIYWSAIRTKALDFSKPLERLVVKTVALNNPTPTKSPPKVEKKPEPIVKKQPKPPESPPKVEKKPEIVKKQPKPPEPPPQKKKEVAKVDDKKRDLLAKAKESIAKIQSSRDNKGASKSKDASELRDLGTIDSLHVDSADTIKPEDMGYYGVLASYLRQALRFPEFGEVKVRLTLNRGGEVTKVETVSTKSENNKQYVEKMLPTLRFPPFGKNFGNDKQHTFTITLTNDL